MTPSPVPFDVVARRDYDNAALRRSQLAASPQIELAAWLEAAVAAGVKEANAMALATAGADGVPDVRMVLLKDIEQDSDGALTWFSNYDSAKARQLAQNPQASLVFYWAELARQVRVTGAVQKTSREVNQSYFAQRPRLSQVSAVASRQSQEIASREALELAVQQVGQQEAPLSCPEHWGGYRLLPRRFEFWQGRRSRLHDRIVYEKEGLGWRLIRLQP